MARIPIARSPAAPVSRFPGKSGPRGKQGRRRCRWPFFASDLMMREAANPPGASASRALLQFRSIGKRLSSLVWWHFRDATSFSTLWFFLPGGHTSGKSKVKHGATLANSGLADRPDGGCLAACRGRAEAVRQGSAASSQSAASPASRLGKAPRFPNAFRLNLLIRSSIIALSIRPMRRAIIPSCRISALPRSGRRTIRRGLRRFFAALRQRQLDLSPVLFFTPKLIAQPQIAQNGLLRLVGYFPTTPKG